MKTALITGATRGIGKAILRLFLAKNIHVIATYQRRSVKAEKLILQYGSERLMFIQFDQGSRASHHELMQRIDRPIDILVNNAGIGSNTVEREYASKHEQDEQLLKVNALGPLWLCEAILAGMAQQSHGKIINIASVGGGIFHYPGFRLADGMSKAAVAFMTRQLAAEYAQTNIDIYALCPGATATDMFRASTLDPLTPDQRETLISALPKKRLIDPAEIAQLCLFLISKEAQILHGAVIDCSLGLGVAPDLINK